LRDIDIVLVVLGERSIQLIVGENIDNGVARSLRESVCTFPI